MSLLPFIVSDWYSLWDCGHSTETLINKYAVSRRVLTRKFAFLPRVVSGERIFFKFYYVEEHTWYGMNTPGDFDKRVNHRYLSSEDAKELPVLSEQLENRIVEYFLQRERLNNHKF